MKNLLIALTLAVSTLAASSGFAIPKALPEIPMNKYIGDISELKVTEFQALLLDKQQEIEDEHRGSSSMVAKLVGAEASYEVKKLQTELLVMGVNYSRLVILRDSYEKYDFTKRVSTLIFDFEKKVEEFRSIYALDLGESRNKRSRHFNKIIDSQYLLLMSLKGVLDKLVPQNEYSDFEANSRTVNNEALIEFADAWAKGVESRKNKITDKDTLSNFTTSGTMKEWAISKALKVHEMGASRARVRHAATVAAVDAADAIEKARVEEENNSIFGRLVRIYNSIFS